VATGSPLAHKLASLLGDIVRCVGRKLGGNRGFEQKPELIEPIVDPQPAGFAPRDVSLRDYARNPVDRFGGIGVEDRRLNLAWYRSEPDLTATALENQPGPPCDRLEKSVPNERPLPTLFDELPRRERMGLESLDAECLERHSNVGIATEGENAVTRPTRDDVDTGFRDRFVDFLVASDLAIHDPA
jgi:hypothetical protein